jgi:hypothetical protein
MALLHEINNGTERFSVADDGSVKVNNVYTLPTAVTTTANYVLTAQTDGSTAWAPEGSTGTVTGSGTLNKVARWTATGSNLGDGPITFATNDSTFAGTVKSTTFLIGNTTAQGIGASLGDINGVELGPGYLTLARDDTADAKQIVFEKNDVEHSFIQTTTDGLEIGGSQMAFSTDSTFLSNYSYTFRDAVGILNPNGTSAATATTVMSIGAMSNSVSLITTGNVGIGTDSPYTKLEVAGDISLNIRSSASEDYIGRLGSASSWTYGNRIGFGFDAAGEGYMGFYILDSGVGDVTPLFLAGNNGGRVGIGTTAPVADLHVGEGSSTIVMGENSSYNGTNRLKYLGSNSVTNWCISHNDTISGALEFIPSTTAGGATFTTPAGTLTSAGTFTVTGDLVAYSDEKLKKNIKTLDGSKVYDMRGVSFEKNGKEGSGVIAQELEKIAPELVHNEQEYKAVAYGNLTGYLIEAIKELKAEIEELKKNR